nr:alpha/beta hydrolase [uncultured Cohaesibacter sp.]
MRDWLTDHVIIDAKRVAYRIVGQGEPVVLVHGTPSSSLIWRKMLPQLVEAGYQAHMYDMLGYGQSERPLEPEVDTSISGQVPVLETLLEHWQLGQFHLIGHDIGGGVAQRFALFHPDQVKSLTLIDSVSFDSYPSRRTRQQLAMGLEALIRAPADEHRAHFREWLLSAVEDRQAMRDGPLNAYLEMITGPIGQGSFFQHQARHYDPCHTMEIADRMHELGRIPVKLIWGAQDAWQTVEMAERLRQSIPGSSLDIIEGAGHFSPEDQPDAIAQSLISFLAGLPRIGALHA